MFPGHDLEMSEVVEALFLLWLLHLMFCSLSGIPSTPSDYDSSEFLLGAASLSEKFYIVSVPHEDPWQPNDAMTNLSYPTTEDGCLIYTAPPFSLLHWAVNIKALIDLRQHMRGEGRSVHSQLEEKCDPGEEWLKEKYMQPNLCSPQLYGSMEHSNTLLRNR